MSKSILITGCSSGIGYQIAKELQQKGYQVIASCRKADDVQRLTEEGMTCIQLDLTNTESIKQAVSRTLALTDNNLYALFNNGAYGQPGALEDLPVAALREQFQTNLFGWHELTTQLIPHFRQRGTGRIILTSSVLGIAAARYRGAYNASKFALEGWADTLRLELRGSGINVSLIEPGPIESHFRENAFVKFNQWIAIDTSTHTQNYQQQIARLSQAKSQNPYTLPPSACTASVIDALESRRPKLRYRITRPTKVVAVLKRLLPGRLLDEILYKYG